MPPEPSENPAQAGDARTSLGSSASPPPPPPPPSTSSTVRPKHQSPQSDTSVTENPPNTTEDPTSATNDSNEDDDTTTAAPPLPEEDVPPLPDEPPPATAAEDDGWAPIWDDGAQAFYFYNRFTQGSTWTNPRVRSSSEPAAAPGTAAAQNAAQPSSTAPGVAPASSSSLALAMPPPRSRPAGGYDPSVHGDYDPAAWYAQPTASPSPPPPPPLPSSLDPGPSASTAAASPSNAELYAATGAFNRFTGRWQSAEAGTATATATGDTEATAAGERYSDESKSRRQMNAFFDVDAAANSHDGRSLKAERSGKRLSKKEVKDFRERRKARKEERRRAWLRD